MKLSELVTSLNIKAKPGERWAVLGPEAEAFGIKLPSAKLLKTNTPGTELDGLLLAGELSATAEADTRLEKIIQSINQGVSLVIVDWRDDGPLDYGPDLEYRYKRGKLCRRLREAGFGLVETLANRPAYYVVQAVKGPPAPIPHAGEFKVVAELAELPKNGMKGVELFGHHIVVANTGKEIVAFAQSCPHANSPLDRGLLRGRLVVCPLHAYIWNVCTGEPVEPADEDILPTYLVKVDSQRGQILVAIAPPVVH